MNSRFANEVLPKPGALRVAIIGAGALGSEVCLRLSDAATSNGSGIAEVLVIDPDRLQPQNLSFGRMYLPLTTGQLKAALVAEGLNGCGPLRWTGLPLEVADVGWQILKGCDLLISCVDSALARIEIALIARRLAIPMLDGGVSADGVATGRVGWFPAAPEAACYLCGIGEARRAEMLAYGLAPTLGCAAPAETVPFSEMYAAHAGVGAAVSETAAALVRSILSFALPDQRGGLDGRLASAERLTAGDELGSTWATERLSLPWSATCPWHDENLGMLVSLEGGQTFRDAIPLDRRKGAPWRVQLAWPVCVEARCRACGVRQERAERLAKLRRRGICTGCQSVGSLDALRCVGSLGSEDLESCRTPSQLGLPDRHLYRLRRTVAMVVGERLDREASA